MPNLEDYSDMELEANAHTPIHCTHHIHIPNGADSRRIMDEVTREAMSQIERGQNYWPFGITGYTPINTTK